MIGSITMGKEQEQEEIDLFRALEKIVNFIGDLLKKIAAMFGCTLKQSYRHKVWFLLVLVASAAAAIYFTSGDKRVYKANMSLSINGGTAFMFEKHIDDMNDFLKDNDHEGLGKILGLDSATASKMKFIETRFFIDKNNDSIIDLIDYDEKYEDGDTVNVRMQDKIVILAGMRDKEMFASLQNAIVNYFNTHDYFVPMAEYRSKITLDKIKMLEHDFAAIDSLQKKDFFENSSQTFTIDRDKKMNLRIGKRELYYDDKMRLFQEKESLNEALASGDNVVSVMSSFMPTKKPINAFTCTFLKIFAVAFVLFVALTLLVDNRRKICNYLDNDKNNKD